MQIVGEKFCFCDAATRFADEAAEIAEVGQRTDRPAVAWPAGRSGTRCGLVDGKFELVAAHRAPCVHAFSPQLGGEFLGIAVDGEDFLGPDALDALHQSGMIGVVGKGDHVIDPVAEFRSRLQCPAGQHGDAFGFQAAQQVRAHGLGRGDDDLPRSRVALEFNGFRQHVESRRAAGHGHRGDGGMQQGGDAMGSDDGKCLLRFTQ